MQLNEFYTLQRELDSSIKEKFGIKDKEHIFDRFLALIVELGEASNEHRGFKFWSEDQEPRVKVPETAWGSPYKNLLLEEFIDSMKFALSIGIELNIELEKADPIVHGTVTKHTLQLVYRVCQMAEGYDSQINRYTLRTRYEKVMSYLLGLGRMYGFTEPEIRQSFLEKNLVNHERLGSGY